MYSFILREGETFTGSRRIPASALGKFYKRNPLDEDFIKQGKRKPKAFIQQFEELFVWEDAGLEAGYGYIYCLPLGTGKCSNDNASLTQKVSSSPSLDIPPPTELTRSPDSITMTSVAPPPLPLTPTNAEVVLVYLDSDQDGRERVLQYLLSLCHITARFALQDKVRIHMVKIAWPLLTSTALDVKVDSQTLDDSFVVSVTGLPDVARLFIDFLKSRITAMEFSVKNIPDHKKTIGLLYGLRYKANELLAGDIEFDDSPTTDGPVRKNYVGYTSCYFDNEGVGAQSKIRMVIVAFLPPDVNDVNIDHDAQRQEYEGVINAMSDVIDTYYETLCPYSSIRQGVNPSLTQRMFALYFVHFNSVDGNVLLCGDFQSVKSAFQWLTEIPIAEREDIQLFKVQDSRVAWMLGRYQHSKVLDLLKRAVTCVTIAGSNQRIVTENLVGHAHAATAVFTLRGPCILVEAAIAEGRNFEKKWIATFDEKYLLEMEGSQGELTDVELHYLKNEGSNLLKKIRNDFGICVKYFLPQISTDSNNNRYNNNPKDSSNSSVKMSAQSRTCLLSANIDSVEIVVEKGDILNAGCEAIINPANSLLSHITGVARTICNVAGPLMTAECSDILQRYRDGRIPISEAVVTDSYDLKKVNKFVRVVVHSVGPVYSTGSAFEVEFYLKAVMNALEKAVEHRASYIAMPLIGSGMFHWPPEAAASLMLGAISKWIRNGGTCKRITLVDVEDSKAAMIVNAVHGFNEKVIPFLVNSARPQSPVALRVPQFAWFWEVHLQDMDPQGLSSMFYQADAVVTTNNRRWMPYDYDQVLDFY